MNNKQKNELNQKNWQEVINDFRTSGLSGSDFSRKHNIPVHQFHYWKSKFKSSDLDAAADLKTSPVVRVVTKVNQRQNSMPDPVWLARFIRAFNENS